MGVRHPTFGRYVGLVPRKYHGGANSRHRLLDIFIGQIQQARLMVRCSGYPDGTRIPETGTRTTA